VDNVLALLAVVLALFTVYVASLRRACVEVDVIGLEALAGTVAPDSPAAPNLKGTLLVSNTGAQATLVTAAGSTRTARRTTTWHVE
jgi:hypothetical protein